MKKIEKYHIETFGCKLNKADSIKYNSILKKFLVQKNPKEADLVFINSCGVIDKTERKIIKKIKEYKKNKKYIILTGCLPYTLKQKIREVDFILPIHSFKELSDFLEKIAKKRKFLSENIKKEDKATAIIPISSGCLGNCSYCATRIARGSLKSRKQEDILSEIKFLYSQGFREFQITSQDIGVYGIDRGEQELLTLLKKIVSIEGDFRIRLGMGNPKYIKKIITPLAEIYKNKKIYKYLHLPVQSGDNTILREMRREYKVEDFIEIIDILRKNYKDFLFATDIIVGFPGEDKDEFMNTYNLIKEVKPHIVNITRFSARYGTDASKLKDLPSRIKKERSRKINSLSNMIKKKENSSFIGKKMNVLITEKRENSKIARTCSYRAVIIKKGEIGKFKNVVIKNCTNNYLKDF